MEVFLFEGSLFACLRRGLGLCWWSWSLQDEALIHVSYEVVIHLLMLSVVFIDMWAACLVRPKSSSKGHSRWNILALVNHIALQSLILQRLIQYLLYIHWAAHLLLLVDWIGLSFVCLSSVLWHFVQNVLDTTQFWTGQVLFFVVAQVKMSLIKLVVINWRASRTASLRLYRSTTILLLGRPFKHAACVLYDWLGNLGSAPHHWGWSTDAIGCTLNAGR